MRPSLSSLFAALERNDVRYVLVGGMAAILHGVPRATLDVDLLIEASPANAQALLAALGEAGLGTADLVTPAEVLANVVTLFEDFLRVDVFLSIPGLSFDEAWRHHVVRDAGEARVRVASRRDLIASKRAKARPKDLEDAADLERLDD